eukprot:1304170-Rhodomonas_salina.3
MALALEPRLVLTPRVWSHLGVVCPQWAEEGDEHAAGDRAGARVQRRQQVHGHKQRLRQPVPIMLLMSVLMVLVLVLAVVGMVGMVVGC